MAVMTSLIGRVWLIVRLNISELLLTEPLREILLGVDALFNLMTLFLLFICYLVHCLSKGLMTYNVGI